MNTNISKRDDGTLVRPLKVLVPLIKDELEAGDAAGLEHYRRAGEMLIEARDQCQPGEWTGWIERNFRLSATTAWRYMKLAEVPKSPRAKMSTLSEATDSSRAPGHRVAWHEPVREIAERVNVEALARERQNREKEDRLLRQLAGQLIDIGYKVLAAKLHPDKGGSPEAMARLNKVRTLLKEAI